MKKNKLYTRIIYLLLTGLLITSCGQRKTAKLKVVLEITSLNGMSESELTSSLQSLILASDDDLDLEDIKLSVQNKLINIEIPTSDIDQKTHTRLRGLLAQKNSGLMIYEVYTNSDLYPKLNKLDEMLRQKDSLTQATAVTPEKKKPETLEEIYAAKVDSAENRNQNKVRGPFNGWLQYNVMQDSRGGYILAPSAFFGYCRIADTAALFTIFRTGYTEKIFPDNLLILTKRSDRSAEMLELYGLRLTPPFKRAAMSGDMIASAQAQKSDYGGIEISMNFKPNYVAEWAALTRKTAPDPSNGNFNGGYLAMVLNNEVLSAPMVNGEIANGKTMVSGNFTKEEADELCRNMCSGYMPCDLKIVSINIIPAK